MAEQVQSLFNTPYQATKTRFSKQTLVALMLFGVAASCFPRYRKPSIAIPLLAGYFAITKATRIFLSREKQSSLDQGIQAWFEAVRLLNDQPSLQPLQTYPAGHG